MARACRAHALATCDNPERTLILVRQKFEYARPRRGLKAGGRGAGAGRGRVVEITREYKAASAKWIGISAAASVTDNAATQPQPALGQPAYAPRGRPAGQRNLGSLRAL